MELSLTKEFWNNRYLNDETGWDVGSISTPIKEYIDQLKDKTIKILIPGCGNAYEAEYLFNNGFNNIYLVDLSPIALENFKKRVTNFPENHLICDDFFNLTDYFDLIIEQTFFCAINPNLRSNYAKQVTQLLNKNGKLVGLLFDEELNNDKPPFGGNKKGYLKIFSPFLNIEIMETSYNSITPRSGRELFIKMAKKLKVGSQKTEVRSNK
ncbi:MAG: SAM-dependent methyltransferase [Bacteroidetes bacterium RIFCSPLOWO2_12_FULL_31_6]|nr:MAG: SAM-dependent methyltransferase [Bacteroidetes bacterium RIFCSPLOWO2_12_FULL_31_6]